MVRFVILVAMPWLSVLVILDKDFGPKLIVYFHAMRFFPFANMSPPTLRRKKTALESTALPLNSLRGSIFLSSGQFLPYIRSLILYTQLEGLRGRLILQQNQICHAHEQMREMSKMQLQNLNWQQTMSLGFRRLFTWLHMFTRPSSTIQNACRWFRFSDCRNFFLNVLKFLHE